MNYPILEIANLAGRDVVRSAYHLHVLLMHLFGGAALLNLLVAVAPSGLAPRHREAMARASRNCLQFLFGVSAVEGLLLWGLSQLFYPRASLLVSQRFLWVAMLGLALLALGSLGFFHPLPAGDDPKGVSPSRFQVIAPAAFVAFVLLEDILLAALTHNPRPSFYLNAFYSVSAMVTLLVKSGILVMSAAGMGLFIAFRPRGPAEAHATIRALSMISLAGAMATSIGCFLLGAWKIGAKVGGLESPTALWIGGVAALGAAMVSASSFRSRLRSLLNPSLVLCLGMTSLLACEFHAMMHKGPFAINNVMYANGILVREKADMEQTSILKHSKWSNLPDEHGVPAPIGARLFAIQCRNCHSQNGQHGLVPRLRNLSPKEIDRLLRSADPGRPYMPPFVGTSDELQQLLNWLHRNYAMGEKKAH